MLGIAGISSSSGKTQPVAWLQLLDIDVCALASADRGMRRGRCVAATPDLTSSTPTVSIGSRLRALAVLDVSPPAATTRKPSIAISTRRLSARLFAS